LARKVQSGAIAITAIAMKIATANLLVRADAASKPQSRIPTATRLRISGPYKANLTPDLIHCGYSWKATEIMAIDSGARYLTPLSS
jgi:hypothetical protein